MEFKTDAIRNVAFIGHSGEGKTSVCEAMLYNAGCIDRIGTVDAGNTVMDFDAEEAARKISISLSIANLEWNGVKLNLLDVPGFFDFEGEFLAALTAADCAVVVTAANAALSVGAEKALDYCVINKIPAFVFVNQMDKENTNFAGAVEALKSRYGGRIAQALIPITDADKRMTGYISLLSGKAYSFKPNGQDEIPMPKEYDAVYNKLHDKLVEDVAASNDEDLMMKFLEGETITRDEMVLGVRKGVASGDAVIVLAGSATQNKGISNLMNQIARLMPAPSAKVTEAFDAADKAVKIAADGSAPVSVRVFKTIADPFVGRLNLFKVMSGCVRNGLTLNNTVQDRQEKISGLFTMRGKKQETSDFLCAGDIGAFAKLAGTVTGDTLCDAALKIKFPPIAFPRPNISMAVSGKTQGDDDKVFSGLARLREEDPTFNIVKNSETAETLIEGAGEIQLEILTKKVKNKFGAEAKLSAPKIPYRETIRKTVDAEGKHKKQSGGHGQYGHAKIRFEHLDGQDFEFDDEVVGGTVPKQYIPAVEKGLLECIKQGVLAGFPVVNIKCVLFDGSYHDVDSSEMAFKLAASLAFKDGCAKAGPVLLEPIMTMRIRIPESYMGDIMGDLNRRRGRILGMESEGEGLKRVQLINAEAPLAEIARYSTDLRSMTQGRGRFIMELARYEEAPATVAAAAKAAYEKERAAEK